MCLVKERMSVRFDLTRYNTIHAHEYIIPCHTNARNSWSRAAFYVLHICYDLCSVVFGFGVGVGGIYAALRWRWFRPDAFSCWIFVRMGVNVCVSLCPARKCRQKKFTDCPAIYYPSHIFAMICFPPFPHSRPAGFWPDYGIYVQSCFRGGVKTTRIMLCVCYSDFGRIAEFVWVWLWMCVFVCVRFSGDVRDWSKSQQLDRFCSILYRWRRCWNWIVPSLSNCIVLVRLPLSQFIHTLALKSQSKRIRYG